MTVALIDYTLFISSGSTGSLNQTTGVGTQPHSPPLPLHLTLLGQEIDNRILCIRAKFCGITLLRAEYITGIIHHHNMQPEA